MPDDKHTSGCKVDPCTCGRQYVGKQTIWKKAFGFAERLGQVLGKPWR